MSYGFSITSGTGSTVTQQSSENPPGVLLDSFFYTWSTTPITYTYSSFTGTTLLPVLYSPNLCYVQIDVNNTAKTVTITGVTLAITSGNKDGYFIILGW